MKKFTVFLILPVIIALTACNQESKKEAARQAAIKDAVQQYVLSLSPEVKISQLFLVNIEGNKEFIPVEKTGSLHGKASDGEALVPGGLLFFSYNIGSSPVQVYNFIQSADHFYDSNDLPLPYAAIDQEGGYVNRLKKINSTFKSQKEIADSMTPEQAERLYDFQAMQMKGLGFTMNLAPVIEVENHENKAFLETRTFGNMEKTLVFGKKQILSFEKQGIGTVAKHFPGNSATDPHSGLPLITYTEDSLEEMVKPFRELLPYASCVLLSHGVLQPKNASVNTKNDGLPADLSSYWVTEVIRNQMGFKGLVISDDIYMGALALNGYPPEKAVVMAVNAGVDVIMLSEKRFGTMAKILLEKSAQDETLNQKINEACCRVIEYKIKTGVLEAENISSDKNSIKDLKFKIKNKGLLNSSFDEDGFSQIKKSGQEVLTNREISK